MFYCDSFEQYETQTMNISQLRFHINARAAMLAYTVIEYKSDFLRRIKEFIVQKKLDFFATNLRTRLVFVI